MSRRRASRSQPAAKHSAAIYTPIDRSVDEWRVRNRVDPGERDPRVWRTWARDVLADAGLLPAPVPAARLGDPEALLQASRAWDLALQKLVECSERIPRGSAEWFAARFEAAAMIRYSARLADEDEAVAAERATMVIGELLAAAERERLLPDARRGLELLDRNRRAAREGGRVRRENVAADLASLKTAALHYRRSDPDASGREMARALAKTRNMAFGTVRDRLRKLGIR